MSLPSVDALPERSIVAARIVVALWLVGWTSKCVLFLEYETTTDDDKRFELQNILASACKARLDIRKLLV
jgi:hypothetical protein